jgi:nitroreductase
MATTRFHHIDTGIAAQTILLGATEKGMGGCMIASADKAAISKLLHLPEAMEINLVIALGYPAEKVVIDEIDDPDDVEYWRDDDGIHHVPKRRLQELILN